ncbi:TonB-dependent receptor [Reichenbachiella sp. MALMAid0571]|uniref:TonB-dependent receptor n=1 Tax=Reichenbachiella sp. MALMAid0571 TaxID=3143939 RepID=UPI0032DF2B0F
MKFKFIRQLLLMSQFAIIGFLVQCLTFTFLLASEVDAQKNQSIENIYLTLEMKEASIKDVFTTIEGKTSFSFAYKRSIIEKNKRISASFEQESLANLLRYISKNTGLSFKRVDETIQVNKNDSEGSFLEEFIDVLADVEISGKITDENGDGLPGASVVAKGTTTGTTTDLDGNYKLTVSEQSLITVSFVGYKTSEILVNNQSVVDVQMELDAQQLEDIVVVGYGTQKKTELTSAIVQIEGSMATKTPSVNLTNSLQGLLPGLNIVQTAASPGFSNPVINIRGSNTFRDNAALIVIDGVASADFEGLNRLNPNDIASISVLKDASAAIYGMQASGGVIVVTTKRGELSKTKVRITTSSSFQSPTRLPKLADALSFMKALNDKEVLDGLSPTYSDDDIAEFTSGRKTSTNWMKSYLDLPIYQGKYDITISGGTEEVKYFVSASTANQNSALVNDDKFKNDQNNIRTNLDFNLFEGLEMGLDLSFRSKTSRVNTYGTSAGLDLASNMNPTFEAFIDDDINLPTNGDAYWSPVAVSLSEGFQKWDTKIYNGKVNLKYLIPNTGGLYVSTFISKIHTSTFRKNLVTPYHYFGKDLITGEIQKIPSILAGTWTYGVHDYFDQNVRNTLHVQIGYDHLFNNAHSVTVFAAYQDMTFKSNNLYAGRTEYNTYAIPELFAGVADTDFFKNDGSSSNVATQTFFGRASYDYKKKYLLTFNFRADGSAIFAPSKRWGYFPGVSAGWLISEEEFMPKNIFSQVKLRASWGKLGNDRVNPFQFLSAYGITNGAVIDNANTQGLNELGSPNPDITWEVATSSDIGMEMSFLDNRLFLEFDYFKVLTENILAKKNFSVPDYTGIILPDQNIGTMKNQGFELQLGFRNRINKFSYKIAGNVATNKNEITFFDEVPNADPEVAAYQNLTGHALGSPLLLHAVGIYKTDDEALEGATYSQARAGFLKYEDKNGDGIINSNDRYRKNLNSELKYGFQFTANYAGFDLAMYFNGSYGDFWQFGNDFNITHGNNLQYVAENSFNLENPNAELPKSGQNSIGIASDFNMQTKSWFRFKTLNLGYTISDNKLLSKAHISKFRIYASADNFFMVFNNMDKYGAVDPELSSVLGAYPMMSTYNLGVDITF